jgi:hypothetical protein
MVRKSEETIMSERKEFLEEQRQHDKQLEERLANAQERTEAMVHSLLKSSRRNSAVQENAQYLDEIQEGLRSMKKEIRRRSASVGSSTSDASSYGMHRKYSMNHLPRAEEVNRSRFAALSEWLLTKWIATAGIGRDS